MLKMIEPYLLYIKLALVAVLVAGASWVSYKLAHADVEKEKQKAVDAAVVDMTKQYKQEKEWREFFQKQSDETLKVILQKIADIKIEHKTITNNITKEIERDPVFYGQALPEGGRQEWLKARALVDNAVKEKAGQPEE